MGEERSVRVYMTEREVTVLGPGKRYVIWVQGCPRSCIGCVAASSHAADAGREMSVSRLALEVLLSGAEGLTISGGEPFAQATALAELVRQIRRKRDIGVIIYTGYLYEELTELPGGAALLAQTDLLIDGPYIQELDDGKSLRGSANQRVIPLTERYVEALPLYGTQEREVQEFQRGFERHRVGLPDGSYEETRHTNHE